MLNRLKVFYRRLLPRVIPLHRYIRSKRLLKDIRANIRWIFRSSVDTTSNDLTVVCLVRNGAGYIKGFIDHHIKLGAAHIVILDNGSSDETINLATNYGEMVTVIQCELPYNKYQTSLKLWLSQEFGQGCWCLVADIDERFEFPFSDRIALTDFLRYLNLHNYSGVVTQMVDLFSDQPISAWPDSADVERECAWFDHSARVSLPFEPFGQWLAGNRYASKELRFLVGGIRKDFFNVGRPMTKQALLFPSRGATVLTPQWTIQARFADVSCALLHYPFNKGFYERCIEIVERNSHWKNSREYRLYLSALTKLGVDFTFKKPSSKRYENINQLVEDGHVVVSDTYLRYVDELQKNG